MREKGENVCENLGKVLGTSYNPEFQLIRLPGISRMFPTCRGLSAGCWAHGGGRSGLVPEGRTYIPAGKADNNHGNKV